jgi:hypothetical protein
MHSWKRWAARLRLASRLALGSPTASLTFTAVLQQLALRVDPSMDRRDELLAASLLQGIQTLTGYNFTVQSR